MKRRMYLGMLAFVLLIGLLFPKPLEAAGKYVSSVAVDAPLTVKGATFCAKQYWDGNTYVCRIIRKKGGKSETILSGVNADFVTNGEVLYYSKHIKKAGDYSWRNMVYCYNIKSKKSRAIAAGTDYAVCGCSGTYLYCGNDNGPDGVKLYAVNVKTKKKKYMVGAVGKVIVSNGKVLTTTNSGDVGNYPIYIFNLNGSGKKKIANGCYAVIKSGKIYYTQYNMKTNKYKVYRCSLKGKNKKAVTKWLNKVPLKYVP